MLGNVQSDCAHPLINQARLLTGGRMPHISTRLGKMKYSSAPPRRASYVSSVSRASVINSNCTGGSVFRWITVARVRKAPPATIVPIFIFLTMSQPSNLLLIASPNGARLRNRRCSSRKKRIAYISRDFSGRFAPIILLAFHGRCSCASGPISDTPMTRSFCHDGQRYSMPARQK